MCCSIALSHTRKPLPDGLATAALSTAPPPVGLLDLRLERGRGGATRIVRRAQRFPLHLTAPLYLDPLEPGMPFLYVQNPSGGVFSGDRLCIRLEVGPGAQAHVTTPSATRLLRMDAGGARQEVELTLERDSYVELLPEPVIPQAGASFEQRLEAELAPGAALITAETVAPGRLALGERFAFDRLLLSTRVTMGGRELCADTILLVPQRRSPAARGVLGGFPYFATLLAVAPERPELVERVTSAVFDMPDAVAAAGCLPHEGGVVVRVLAMTPMTASRMLHVVWSTAREVLLGHPAPRVRK
jgi:urease accessory protein